MQLKETGLVSLMFEQNNDWENTYLYLYTLCLLIYANFSAK